MKLILRLWAFQSAFVLYLLIGVSGLVYAQVPEVPSEMTLGDMTLEIAPSAQKIIQTDVNALFSYPKYFQIKLERVDMFFPIIERVLKEENMPDDFKYLAIQESGLISDAVSSSNAVGFWQFKKESGEEVGLRIDDQVDERMNIVASTRGAAKYLKRNYFQFDNWVYALLAYNLGRGGAEKVVNKQHYGAKKMQIDSDTHWYVLKFLAHKVAFENHIGKNPNPAYVLKEYPNGTGKSLRQIAVEQGVEEKTLTDYNKWLKAGIVPEEKPYVIIYPLVNNQEMVSSKEEKSETVKVITKEEVFEKKGFEPLPLLVNVNRLPAVMAREGDNVVTLAAHGGIPKEKFLKYNDLAPNHQVVPGQIYYLKSKRNKAKVHYHTLHAGETVWSVSQKFGVKVNAVIRKNRMKSENEAKEGLVLWLRFIRPANQDPEYKEIITAKAENPLPVVKPESEATVAEDSLTQVQSQPSLMAKELVKENTEVVESSPGIPESDAEEVEEEIVDQGDSEVDEVEEDGIVEEEVAEEEKEEEELQAEISDEKNEIEKTEEEVITPTEEVRFISTSPAGTSSGPAKEMHEVKQGETLYAIARMYTVAVAELLDWNNLNLEEGIKIGQLIRVSKPAVIKAEQAVVKKAQNEDEAYIYHEVSEGETLYKIAREYQVTIKDVMDWNDKKEFNVSIGEKIKIKKQQLEYRE